MAHLLSHRLTGSLPIVGAALAGLATVATFTLAPAEVLEGWVWSSGIAALIPAAEPPLGVTARTALALAGGGAAAAVAWAALYLLWGPGGYLHRRAADDGAPSVRRADAHPDAPPRRPMSAADLGTPLMDVVARSERAVEPEPEAAVGVMEAIVPAGRALPADLDTPLANFDPEAMPAPHPAPVSRPATPMLAPGERLETFQLMPTIRLGSDSDPEDELRPPLSAQPGVRVEPASPPSLDQLIRRLEQGAQRRAAIG